MATKQEIFEHYKHEYWKASKGRKGGAKGTFRGLKSQNHRSTERWFCGYLNECLENKWTVRTIHL
jgi:hypothetical protein